VATSEAGAHSQRSARPDLAEESFGQLLSELASDTSTLVKQEIALARVELGDKARKAGRGAGLLAGAAVFGLLALGALTALLIVALDAAMDLWLAALIVTVLWAIVALVLAQSGRSAVSRALPAQPEQTIETLKEDVQWAKHPTRSART
jgi:uncharacterized membrane protein YqjE